METGLGFVAMVFTLIALYFALKARLIRLEQKLTLLMRQQGIDAAVVLGLSERVQELARDPAQKLNAIRIYREETGASLTEARQVIETFLHSR